MSPTFIFGEAEKRSNPLTFEFGKKLEIVSISFSSLDPIDNIESQIIPWFLTIFVKLSIVSLLD